MVGEEKNFLQRIRETTLCCSRTPSSKQYAWITRMLYLPTVSSDLTTRIESANLTETKRARWRSRESTEMTTRDSEEGKGFGDALVDGRVWQIRVASGKRWKARPQQHINTSRHHQKQTRDKMDKRFQLIYLQSIVQHPTHRENQIHVEQKKHGGSI